MSSPPNDLDPQHRIALAYAPKSARAAWLALLAFEQRMADTARPGREPIMIQLRLAWWRDRLAEDGTNWPVSEPLLAQLVSWQGRHGALGALIDGWEAMIVGEDGGTQLCEARVKAHLALADLLGVTALEPVERMARDLATGKGDVSPGPPVARPMRPLAVLRVLARRERRDRRSSPFADLLRVMRAGLLGF
ncbi:MULTISPECIES: hypothetical protein [Novosphingobium]|uniref:hypothetical protein n=1 Tax=Novosphingobium TaxID=165696 RepID=UPI000D6DCCF6|nr:MULTISPECIES: hypothetical protein [Novosphingobium]